MITRRDIGIALFTMSATLATVAVTYSQGNVMQSSIFDWQQIEAKETPTGFSRRFFRGATATLDELECHVTTLKPGEASHPPHKHPEEEILIIKEGMVESLVNGQMKRVGPGSVIFQASNQMHNIKNVGNVPATYHVFSWHSPGMLKNKAKN
ncbi:hypothetical protein AAE02nite_28060 [Adhaeribacter aerolatus]|uniref:Cupin type-2 domain-containing protein n=1 Tax=Adhaeribacter aerolatus TaxID=670289 RepID=A0A512AZK0_9BACT|nr:cupin domain-containing protein [Adhaeribacter aerolatus]GEO05142.1 hypothetical protein AAE02nite_28060 [Adhaeribacter aerolatus]